MTSAHELNVTIAQPPDPPDSFIAQEGVDLSRKRVCLFLEILLLFSKDLKMQLRMNA